MKVHLRKRKMRLKKGTSKPRYSLYLDIYYRKGKRKREFLGIYLESNDDKTYRNEKLKLAENIKAKRMMELANEAHGFPTKEKLNQNFIAYFEKQLNKREGNSRTAWNNTYTHLTRWSGPNVPFTDVDREWLEEFIEYLHSKVSPSSVSTYFAKVKCALSESVKDKILIQNPSFFVDPFRVPESSREYLTIEEIQRINDVDFHNDVVKRAFLFSCFAGLRYGSVGRPELQKFVGALHGKRAKKGVFITTSTFAKGAIEYVMTIDPKVILIDGKKLSQYMIDFNLGVTTSSTYELKKMDSDYFQEDE